MQSMPALIQYSEFPFVDLVYCEAQHIFSYTHSEYKY